jgi:hypothetical protein
MKTTHTRIECGLEAHILRRDFLSVFAGCANNRYSIWLFSHDFDSDFPMQAAKANKKKASHSGLPFSLRN